MVRPYKFRFTNNHIVVEIPDQGLYLLDTGSPKSFSLIPEVYTLTIDDKQYPLTYSPHIDVARTERLVNSLVHGIIGLDILKQTSFTLFKYENGFGEVYFSTKHLEGTRVPLATSSYIYTACSVNNQNYRFLIDTGAFIGYTEPEIADNHEFVDIVEDYNPILGVIPAKKYRIPVKIGNKTKTIDVGVNDNVTRYCLIPSHCSFICGINDFFDEYACFNFKERVMIIK